VNGLIEAIKEQNQVIATLLQKEQMHTKQPAVPLHGIGGIFSGPGLERDVITAHVRPMGILSVLPRIPTVTEDPRFAAITGWTDVTGSEPTDPCDDAPYGYIKGCNLTARFGLIRRDTKEIDIGKVGLIRNRGDYTDLVLRGRVLGLQNLVPSNLNEEQVLNILTMSEMIGAGVQAERRLNIAAWQGTVAANLFPGLDVQIATGQKDADTGQLCPALDSKIMDFNYGAVDGASPDIVEYLSAMEYYLRNNARRMGLEPVKWIVVMRPELWQVLSAVWPCRYITNRCTDLSGNTVAVINDDTNTRMRDDMRNRMVIPINGTEYPVVEDDGIYEHSSGNDDNLAPGEFASSIYMVPLTVTGNFPVCYLEYLDYRRSAIDNALLRGLVNWFWTDDGMFMWSATFRKSCFTLHLRMEPRIVLRTPHLAGKLQHVKYSPLEHLRSPHPDSDYFVDGGVSAPRTSTTYAAWL